MTQQIAANLAAAAQTATADGNTAAATQLTKLSTAFSTAAQTGQLPDIDNPSTTAAGGHHHHRHAHGAESDSGDDSTTTTSSSTTNATTSSLNPLTIIQNTLSNAGVPS